MLKSFLFLLLLQVPESKPVSKQDAKVKVCNGYYVYFLSRPVRPFKHMSTVTLNIDSAQCNDANSKLAYVLGFMRDSIPGAEGVIVPSLKFDTAFIIRFR